METLLKVEGAVLVIMLGQSWTNRNVWSPES